MVGKNFSGNNLGQRKKSDFYETPYSITGQLLDRVTLNGSILEPSSGMGAIVKVLNERGYMGIQEYEISTGSNFLENAKKFDTVITNPPFSLALEFIHHAQKVANEDIYFLLPLSYLHGKTRFDDVYENYRNLKTVYVFTRYPMLGDELREDGKYRTGMMVYAWFHFQKKYNGDPSIKWIDNNCYVLGARK